MGGKLFSLALFISHLSSSYFAQAVVVSSSCSHDACYNTVLANREGHVKSVQHGCTSFFRTTVTPTPVTHTRTALQTASSTVTVTKTLTVDVTHRSTTHIPSTLTADVTQSTTIVVEDDVLSTVYDLTTVYSTDVISDLETTTIFGKRGIGFITTTTSSTSTSSAAPSCPTPQTVPSALPSYASTCSNTMAYSSACSCLGVTHEVTTLHPCTNTVEVTATTTHVHTVTHIAAVIDTIVKPITVVNVFTDSVVDLISVTSTSTSVDVVTSPSTVVVATSTTSSTTTTVCAAPTNFIMAISSDDSTYMGAQLAIESEDACFDTNVVIASDINTTPTIFTLTPQGYLEVAGADMRAGEQDNHEIPYGAIYFEPVADATGHGFPEVVCSAYQADPTVCAHEIQCSVQGNNLISYCSTSGNEEGKGLSIGTSWGADCTPVAVALTPFSGELPAWQLAGIASCSGSGSFSSSSS